MMATELHRRPLPRLEATLEQLAEACRQLEDDAWARHRATLEAVGITEHPGHEAPRVRPTPG